MSRYMWRKYKQNSRKRTRLNHDESRKVPLTPAERSKAYRERKKMRGLDQACLIHSQSMAIIMDEKHAVTSIKYEPTEIITIDDTSNYSDPEPVQVAVKEERGTTSSALEIKTEHADLSEYKPLVNIKEKDEQLPGDDIIPKIINDADHKLDIKPIALEEFSVKQEVSDEENTQTDVNATYACEICSYKSRSREKLRRHVQMHTGEKSNKCNGCEYTTILTDVVKTDMFTRNQDFKCDICNFAATCEDALNHHVPLHTKEKAFASGESSYEAETNQNQRTHVTTHQGRFKCSKCKYSAESKRTLKDHMLTHKQKLFECYTCGHKTCLKSNLRRHVVTHFKNRIKRYSCSACKSRFLHKKSMLRHMSVRPCKPYKLQAGIL